MSERQQSAAPPPDAPGTPPEPEPTAPEPEPTAPEPEPEPTALEVEPAEVAAWRARRPDLQIVDVREPREREAGHIEGSRHIELVELSARAGELAPDAPIVFYCRVGARSEMAAQAFRAAGLRAHSMRGGLLRWAAEERPLVPAEGHVADH